MGIRRLKVTIQDAGKKDRKTILYTIDFTWLSLAYLSMIILVFLVSLDNIGSDIYFVLSVTGFIAALSLIIHLIIFWMHWSMFSNTIKHGPDDLGNYNWNAILKRKTDAELLEIIQGKRSLPEAISVLAKKELKSRK